MKNSKYAIDASNGFYRDPLTMKTHKVEYDYVRGKYYHRNQTGSSTFWVDGEIYVKPLWGQNTFLGDFESEASLNADKLLPPVDLKYPITSPYTEGNRNIPELNQNRPHRAIDIGTPVGTYIISPWSGTIVMASPTDYGLAVIIRHDYTYNDDFIQTGYAHLSDMFVTQGMEIQRGDSIGLTGTFGTGPHLHFTLRSGNRKVDPTLLFPYK